MKTFYILTILGISAAVVSCEDPTPAPNNTGNTPTQPVNNNPNNLSKTQLITKHTWKLTSFTQGVPGAPTATDLFGSGIPNCQKDDIYKFAVQDSAATIENGAVKCGTTETTKTGKWYFKNGEGTLALKISGQTTIGLNGDFTLKELGETKMILKQTVSGSEYTSIYTAQ